MQTTKESKSILNESKMSATESMKTESGVKVLFGEKVLHHNRMIQIILTFTLFSWEDAALITIPHTDPTDIGCCFCLASFSPVILDSTTKRMNDITRQEIKRLRLKMMMMMSKIETSSVLQIMPYFLLRLELFASSSVLFPAVVFPPPPLLHPQAFLLHSYFAWKLHLKLSLLPTVPSLKILSMGCSLEISLFTLFLSITSWNDRVKGYDPLILLILVFL